MKIEFALILIILFVSTLNCHNQNYKDKNNEYLNDKNLSHSIPRIDSVRITVYFIDGIYSDLSLSFSDFPFCEPIDSSKIPDISDSSVSVKNIECKNYFNLSNREVDSFLFLLNDVMNSIKIIDKKYLLLANPRVAAVIKDSQKNSDTLWIDRRLVMFFNDRAFYNNYIIETINEYLYQINPSNVFILPGDSIIFIPKN